MNKQKKIRKLITLIVVSILIICINHGVFAVDIIDSNGEIDYSKEYIEWLNLNEETRKNSIMPRMYNVYMGSENETNPLKTARLVGSTIANKFSLKDIIKDNMVIKDQGNLGACWAFAGLGSLETNLALTDYYNGNTTKKYDFSERHLEYATSKTFLNGKINPIGYDRKVGDGGSYTYTRAYLTNGTGAVNEEDMPYKDTSELIDLSEIQNKKVTSEVYDITEFPSKTTSNFETLKSEMKNHIKNYGGINTAIHEGNYCLNNKTGALYCSNTLMHTVNHGVLIVGWDDDYSVDNFKETSKPSENGAWIVKDSHGTDDDHKYTLEAFKKMLFESDEEYFKRQGITSSSQITDDFVKSYAERAGYTIENGKICLKHNDNGYLYISYEDVNIYSSMMGITKSANNIDYTNIYQYDELGAPVSIPLASNDVYLANIFEKKSSDSEFLNQVGITVPETVTCKVYVNPNGEGKSKDELQLVQLKEGESETFNAGYHTLEFLNPIEIKANKFVVAVELIGTKRNSIYVSVECNYPDFYKKTQGKDLPEGAVVKGWSTASIESEKCFYTVKNLFEQNTWGDSSKLYSDSKGKYPDSDSTIKAFTVTQTVGNVLESIEITTPPTKTEYTEGENFDKTGMVVNGIYKDGSKKEIKDYKILNGDNLKLNQTSITVSYNGKTAVQNITVKANTQIDDNDKKSPISSNFDNSNLNVSSIKYYTFTDPNTKEYVLMNMTVNNVSKNSINDGYKYYYYLSSNQEEDNISDWVEIKNEQKSSDKIELEINTKDIKNYGEISKSNTLYLYIKEIAKKDGNEATIVTKSMKINSNVEAEYYLDNVKIENSNTDNKGNNNNNNSNTTTDNSGNTNKKQNVVNNQDSSKSPNKLPSTGVKTIIIGILVISILGVILFIKYKNISKYVK